MRRLIAEVARLWRRTRSLLGVLSLLRFHLLVLAIGLVLVLQVAQIRDLLLSYGLDFSAERAGWLSALLLAMEGCALTLWYSARVMLRFRFAPAGERGDGNDAAAPDCSDAGVEAGDHADDPGVPPPDADSLPPDPPCPSDSHAWPRVKKHLPRMLGGGVFMIFLIGLHSLWREYPFQPLFLALSVTLAFALYVVLVRYRRVLFGLPSYEDEVACNNLREFAELPRTTRGVYYALLAANVVFMVLAVSKPLALAAALGPGAALLIAAGLFVVVGSTFVYWSNWAGVPVVTLAVLYVIAASFVNENHLVRVCPGMNSYDFDQACLSAPVAADDRDDAEAALEQWVAARAGAAPSALPLFIVATEGGGIRAAWWTAAVLGELQDRAGGDAFADHVFAISGVSGGSLGAAVFAAQVADGVRSGSFRERADAILSEDFLGPTLTTLMFPDLLQRFLPWPVFDDRAVTLEQSWEAAWRKHSAGDVFAAPFLDLWRRGDARVPLLFLNSTVVETGQRLVHSPVLLHPPGGRRAFRAALDGRRVLGDGVPLSTVAHNSARFSYVSPAGLALRRDRRARDTRAHWIRLVDGGYFENSAALTAAELLQIVFDARERLEAAYSVSLRPHVIRVRNSEAEYDPDCAFASGDEDELASGKSCARRQLLHESVTPLRALLNVRPAHARLAAEQLREMAVAADIGYTELSLRNNGVVHPLGWMLSGESRRDMTCQAVGYTDDRCLRAGRGDGASVTRDIDAVVAALRAARAAAAP